MAIKCRDGIVAINVSYVSILAGQIATGARDTDVGKFSRVIKFQSSADANVIPSWWDSIPETIMMKFSDVHGAVARSLHPHTQFVVIMTVFDELLVSSVKTIADRVRRDASLTTIVEGVLPRKQCRTTWCAKRSGRVSVGKQS